MTQGTRWRSNRRRSSEKSAARIRSETPPFWRIHTEGSNVGEDGRYVIERVKDGYTVVVNGKPFTTPVMVYPNRDRITLVETAQPSRVIRSTGKTRLAAPPPWLVQGVRVDYRQAIGGAITHRNRLVLSAPFTVNNGKQWCALVDGVRGWVAVEALSKASSSA